MGNFNSKFYLALSNRKVAIHRIKTLEEQNKVNISRLPFSIRILVENLLRKLDGDIVKEEDVIKVANWKPFYEKKEEIPYFPARVIMQDFTGVPAVVDLAAMRDAMKDLGGDPRKINPAIPVDLIIDHSVQIDYYGSPDALIKNMDLEYQRNRERYSLLKWAQKAFDNFRIFPPGSGIIHQVNLEYISRVITTREEDGEIVAFPDTLIGTDSHTTMINGMGVMGWGVGGIEAESVMLGQPLYMKIPEVIGVKLVGEIPERVTATDAVLTITEILRKENVVEKFVEFFGPGVKRLSLTDRAIIANMSPEYGATMGFFPVDEQVLEYLKLTNREELSELVEAYTKEQMMFYYGNEEPEYTKVIEVDLSEVESSLAGPRRPQDRINLYDMGTSFNESLAKIRDGSSKKVVVDLDGENFELSDGSVVIASITSCTNTSNPDVLIGAGILAKRALEKGLTINKYVKTSFAPGSRVVEEYLSRAGLMNPLEALGFHIVGYGCATCIGNSGPLHPEIEKAIDENNLVVGSVLSGNRNFEARVHQKVKTNYLASPLLVVAFAIAGRVDIDLENEPLGYGSQGEPVFLKDMWPTKEEIASLANKVVTPDIFKEKYKNILEGDDNWKTLPVEEGNTFKWDENSTYIRRVPFFDNLKLEIEEPQDIRNARTLLVLGDTVTTDHISPAGAIPMEYPAGEYLLSHDVKKEDFNSYGSRRGNHEVMMRGTFANIRIKNKLVSPKEGGLSIKFPERTEDFVFNVSGNYLKEGTPLFVLGGKEYGTGSSRDWAAKGTFLLGVKAVIAQSYERIHRSNLVGMGVLPLQFEEGVSFDSLGLTGGEKFHIEGIPSISPGMRLKITAIDSKTKAQSFTVITRLDTEVEIAYFKNNGILPYVLRQMAKEGQ